MWCQLWTGNSLPYSRWSTQVIRTFSGKFARTCAVCGATERHRETFFLEALGQIAVEAGLKVAWFSLEELGVLVRRHRADDSVTRAVRAILRAKLIVVDDIGLLPVSPDAAEGFFRLVDAAYEKRSVAVSSNVHPAGFDELMPKTLATATVDRLLHHAHVCLTSGDSVRLAQATSGKGVVPLNMAREAGHAA
jgi:DNA replication protein DnaC